MKIKKVFGNNLIRAIILLFLIIMTLICLMPFYWIAIMGTLKNGVIYNNIPLLPGGEIIENFKLIISQIPFFKLLFNSLTIATCSTVLTIFFSALAGYTFAKIDFAFKEQLFVFVLATMMISGQLTLIGFIQEMKAFHFMDTFFPLILPSIANAFGIFMIRQYTASAIPNDLLDSARVDGCNEFRIFIQIAFPIMTPIVMALGILSFLGSWNNYLLPLVVLISPDKLTLPLGVAMLKGLYATNLPIVFLGMFFSMLPILIVYFCLSKFIISGLTAGSVKG